MSAKQGMLAKFVAAEGRGQAALKTTGPGCYVVECPDPQKLRMGDVPGGPLDDCHEPEIEVQFLGRPHRFKLSVLSWAPTAQQGVEHLRSNSASARLQALASLVA